MLTALHLQQGSEVSVRYGEKFESETFKLLEVDERQLQELLQSGLSIKGRADEEAVLCTSTATYAIKFVSTSNTVLLIPPRVLGGEDGSAAEASVAATAAGHIELVEISPKLDYLKYLLSERPYKEEKDGEAEGEGLYTWEDLVAKVQASETQLKVGLKALQAVEIGKYWRIADDNLMRNLLEILLLTAIQHDWPLNAVPGLEAVRALDADGYSPEIVLHCLETFGKRKHSELETEAVTVSDLAGLETSWAMDEKRVCLCYARQLIATSSKWKLEEFLGAWKKACPDEMSPRLDMLKGEVIVDVVGLECWLHGFSVSSLPRKPEGRFSALFKRRPRWEWEDLEPYLMDLKEPNQSVEAMLLKFARKTQPDANSPVFYSAR